MFAPPSKKRPSQIDAPWVSYVVALLLIALATWARRLLDPALANSLPFITMFPAVAFAAWFGGKGPGFLATLVGAALAAYVLLEPRGSFAVERLENQVGLILYGVVCTLLIFMFDSHKRTLQKVQAQKLLFQTTLGSIGDAVIVTDASAMVRMMNPTAESLTGWPLDDARGRDLQEVFNIVNEDTRKQVESPVAKAIRAGVIVGLAKHTILIARDKTEYHIDESAAPIRNEREQIIGVVMVFRDIGAKRIAEKKVQASEIRYRRLFEAASDGILILDADTGKTIDVNRFMLDLLRQPRESILDKELWELGLFPDAAENQEALEAMQAQGAVRNESTFYDRDGRRVNVEFICSLYREGERPVIQVNLRDVSERKRFADEREAHMVNEQLLRMEAENANRAKDMFLATLSHEMRTPLSAIIGWVRLLQMKQASGDEVKEGLAVIDRNSKAQLKLIEDVLDVSRIVSGKMRLEMKPSEMADIIRAGVDAVRAAADARDITLETKLDPAASRISCDEVRMQQVVWNLVSNAVKFTPKGGTVTSTLARERSNIKIQVKDNGQGMDKDLLPFVFDRFHQADSSSKRKFGGLGLGLSIVKHIVEAHGGSVKAESEGEGKGSMFTVLLPIRAVQLEADSMPSTTPRTALGAEASESHPLVRLDGMRVLVVDDEADARQLLVKVLEQAGAKVLAASSAREALDILSQLTPEVLVSDLGMPEEDGLDLIRKVRGRGLHPRDLPAVALTAFVSKEDQRAALLAGFQVHVAKPVDPHDLTAVIASLTGRTN